MVAISEHLDRTVANQRWINYTKSNGLKFIKVEPDHGQVLLQLIHGTRQVNFLPLDMKLSGYYRKVYEVSPTNLKEVY